MSAIVIRYHEISLKRGNRAWFAARLARNVRRACRDLPLGEIRDRHGRLLAEVRDDAAWPAIRARLVKVFGIANFSLARSLAAGAVWRDAAVDLGPLERAVVEAARGLRFESFRIATRRAEKRFPLTSPEVNAAVGAAMKARTGARVDLEQADLTVTIEILPGEILYSVEKVAGAGGLPVGTGGHVLALLSGGIDSPVAAARMMRRGCRASFVHFHASPYLDRSSQEKCREIARRLAAYEFDVRLVLVPFAEVQREIVTRVAPPPRVILYRRMMMRIACAVARSVRASALVTGESLAQVASQTLANLTVIERASDLPVLRPLIGMDKLEVSDEALRLGTFDLSIQPDQDCCSLFVPRHPVTRSRLGEIEALESALDAEALVRGAIAQAEVERYFFPDGSAPARLERLRPAEARDAGD